MAKPNSRTTFIDYCLRNLGAPVIEINVDEDQLDDRVDDAIQYYQEYHGDAVVRNIRKHRVTNSEIVVGGFSGMGSVKKGKYLQQSLLKSLVLLNLSMMFYLQQILLLLQ